ncbi:hypothetical protein ALP74_01750 [Pseudomonas coronafaciens pv. garcae]|uniref:Uncharacterized protein n=1 Tax=Pseudomonas coronafaciens pv. garcae TaxID=251653 RepID=A0AB37QHU8_9PSED|nr:hypothetical protein HBB04_03621 [Pseudomonas coronafaciens]RMR94251.1 hypothetical protein ALP74_01750 [Pseudomonas coronafaciens pv. garcae]RMV71987.1 hypothetical protein ALP06_00666 [Pseudomonas coronafaciens pv. atropurpurea]
MASLEMGVMSFHLSASTAPCDGVRTYWLPVFFRNA